jgi:hypothetical protein
MECHEALLHVRGFCRKGAFSRVWESVSYCIHDTQFLDFAQKAHFATELGLPPRVRPHTPVHRFTIDHVAPILTSYGIAHLDSLADDRDGFAIGTRGHRAIAFAVTGGTGHGLGVGDR